MTVKTRAASYSTHRHTLYVQVDPQPENGFSVLPPSALMLVEWKPTLGEGRTSRMDSRFQASLRRRGSSRREGGAAHGPGADQSVRSPAGPAIKFTLKATRQQETCENAGSDKKCAKRGMAEGPEFSFKCFECFEGGPEASGLSLKLSCSAPKTWPGTPAFGEEGTRR